MVLYPSFPPKNSFLLFEYHYKNRFHIDPYSYFIIVVHPGKNIQTGRCFSPVLHVPYYSWMRNRTLNKQNNLELFRNFANIYAIDFSKTINKRYLNSFYVVKNFKMLNVVLSVSTNFLEIRFFLFFVDFPDWSFIF